MLFVMMMRGMTDMVALEGVMAEVLTDVHQVRVIAAAGQALTMVALAALSMIGTMVQLMRGSEVQFTIDTAGRSERSNHQTYLYCSYILVIYAGCYSFLLFYYDSRSPIRR